MRPSAYRTRVRRPLVRLVVWTLSVVLVLWLGATAVLLLMARERTVRGIDALDRARHDLTAAALLRGEGLGALRAAIRDFDGAHDRADHPLLAPWSVVPLLGTNVRSAEVLTAAAAEVARIGERAARELSALLEAPVSSNAERLAQLESVANIAASADRALATIDLGSDFFLVGPFGDARRRFVDRLAELRDALTQAREVARGLRGLMVGPRRYLVVAANNAEMRAGSGMLLSAGIATFVDGSFSVGPMRPTAEVNLLAGAVNAPADYQRLWNWLTPTQEFRNLDPSPRFEVNAPLAAQMWQAATGESVDGVLAVDPIALAALVTAQGPIEAGGRTLSGDELATYLFFGQYQGLGVTPAEQAARRDQLSAVARAAVGTLQGRAWDTAALVEHLSGVGRGRHLLAWARDPDERHAWRAAGIDGALTADSLAVSLLNVGANKLDQFLHVDARLRIDELAAGGSEAVITLRLRNDAPTGLPTYVAGPDPRSGLSEGEYGAVLVVNGPGAGAVPVVQGQHPILAGGRDGPTKVVAVTNIRVDRGETVELLVRIELPEGFRELRVESSARVPPVTWRFAGRTWVDDHVERLAL
jgi:hypothetical protein